MIGAEELDNYFACAKQLVLEAGEYINEGINTNKEVESKDGDWDLVTKYDKEVAKILIDGLKGKFPSHKFIAGETELTSDPTWIISAIDGALNFAHSFPQTCVSVAFVLGKTLQIGVVYNPSYNELYSAKRGQGTYLNDKRIKTSNVTTIKQALVTTEITFNHLSSLNREIAQGRTEALAKETQGIRQIGSVALSLALLARGALDCFQCIGLKSRDTAAGIILVEEAGGHICDSKGGPFDLSKTGFIGAANVQLAAEISRLIIQIDLKTQRKRLKRT